MARTCRSKRGPRRGRACFRCIHFHAPAFLLRHCLSLSLSLSLFIRLPNSSNRLTLRTDTCSPGNCRRFLTLPPTFVWTEICSQRRFITVLLTFDGWTLSVTRGEFDLSLSDRDGGRFVVSLWARSCDLSV